MPRGCGPFALPGTVGPMASADEIPPIPTPAPGQAAPADSPAAPPVVPPAAEPVVPPVESAPTPPTAAAPPPAYVPQQAGYEAPAPAQGYATPLYAPAPPPYVDGQPRGLSLASMICGIAGAFLSLFAFGFLPSVAAVILGHIGIRRQPNARALAITGLVTGYIGIAISLIWGLIIVFIVIAAISHGNGVGAY